jgi:hypothetical protein
MGPRSVLLSSTALTMVHGGRSISVAAWIALGVTLAGRDWPRPLLGGAGGFVAELCAVLL